MNEGRLRPVLPLPAHVPLPWRHDPARADTAPQDQETVNIPFHLLPPPVFYADQPHVRGDGHPYFGFRNIAHAPALGIFIVEAQCGDHVARCVGPSPDLAARAAAMLMISARSESLSFDPKPAPPKPWELYT